MLPEHRHFHIDYSLYSIRLTPQRYPRFFLQMDTLDFELVTIRVRIRCLDRNSSGLFRSAYGHLTATPSEPQLEYSIAELEPDRFRLERNGSSLGDISGAGRLLAIFDDDLVIALQLLRPDLYFLHAAVLARNGVAFAFPAPAGSGKSTLTWALSNRGFDYLSDELAPIDLDDCVVEPFLRPICLKSRPPRGFEIEAPTVATERGIHISPAHLGGAWIEHKLPLAALFFPRYDPSIDDSAPREISVARATARIYANCLNALAHSERGLAGAESLASRLPCFEIATASLDQACDSVRHVADTL